jgi:fibrillarin-like rRNA methylase
MVATLLQAARVEELEGHAIREGQRARRSAPAFSYSCHVSDEISQGIFYGIPFSDRHVNYSTLLTTVYLCRIIQKLKKKRKDC